MRSLALAAALVAPFQAANLVLPAPDDIVVPPGAIVQVVCINKDGMYMGTAFRVGAFYLSVKHVTSAPGQCFIGKQRIHIAYTSPTEDFSMISADNGPIIPVDCGGFIKGKRYLSLGYARGRSEIMSVELTGTDQIHGGQSVLEGMGAIIPGMSGGPLLDEETGKAVGTNNTEDFQDGLSGSVPLSKTPVCSKA